MGDANQLIYLKHWLPRVEGPILEAGSQDYGSAVVNLPGMRRGRAG